MQTMAPSDRYLADRVMTASPAELTAMLYDGVCASIRGAVTRLEAGDRLEALPRIQKAQAILLELRVTLDPTAGPLSGQLDALYSFAWSRLLEASTGGSARKAQDALDVVEPLRSAWRQACLLQAA